MIYHGMVLLLSREVGWEEEVSKGGEGRDEEAGNNNPLPPPFRPVPEFLCHGPPGEPLPPLIRKRIQGLMGTRWGRCKVRDSLHRKVYTIRIHGQLSRGGHWI